MGVPFEGLRILLKRFCLARYTEGVGYQSLVNCSVCRVFDSPFFLRIKKHPCGMPRQFALFIAQNSQSKTKKM